MHSYYAFIAYIAIHEVGKRLIEAKKQVAHGEWAEWLEKKVSYTERTAQRFMQCAERFSNSELIPNLNTTQMIALLSLPESETKPFIESKAAEGKPVEDMAMSHNGIIHGAKATGRIFHEWCSNTFQPAEMPK